MLCAPVASPAGEFQRCIASLARSLGHWVPWQRASTDSGNAVSTHSHAYTVRVHVYDLFIWGQARRKGRAREVKVAFGHFIFMAPRGIIVNFMLGSGSKPRGMEMTLLWTL